MRPGKGGVTAPDSRAPQGRVPASRPARPARTCVDGHITWPSQSQSLWPDQGLETDWLTPRLYARPWGQWWGPGFLSLGL